MLTVLNSNLLVFCFVLFCVEVVLLMRFMLLFLLNKFALRQMKSSRHLLVFLMHSCSSYFARNNMLAQQHQHQHQHRLNN